MRRKCAKMLTFYLCIVKPFCKFEVRREPTDSSWTVEGNRAVAKAARWEKNLVPIYNYGYYTSSFLDRQCFILTCQQLEKSQMQRCIKSVKIMVKFNSIPSIAIWWKHTECQCGGFFYGMCWLHDAHSFPGERRSTVVWKCSMSKRWIL